MRLYSFLKFCSHGVKSPKSLISTLLFCLTSFFTLLHAQDKDSVKALPEIVLTTYSQKDQALGITSVSNIGVASLNKINPTDFSTAMNQISGLQMFSGTLNTQRITIRGVGSRTPFGTNKLKMYFDNIPITNGTGESTVEAFDLENLSLLEVVKGPKAMAFGSQLGGAILLNTRNSYRHKNYLGNSFSLGSYGLLKNNLSFSHSDEKWQLAFRYGLMETNGYRDNSSFDRSALLVHLKYHFNVKSSLSLLLNQVDYKAFIPSSLNYEDFMDNPRQAAFTWNAAKGFEENDYSLIGLTYEYKLNDKFNNNTSIFYTYLDHYEPRPFNILEEYTHGYGLRSIFSGNLKLLKKEMKLQFGLESYTDQYNWQTFRNLYRDNNGNGSLKGEALSENKELRKQLSLFSQIQIPLSQRLSLQFGLHLQKTTYDYRDRFNLGAENMDAKRDFGFILNPSLDLTYRIKPNVQFYGNISRGFSNPSLEESLNPDGIINPDIERETGINYELGTHLNSKDGQLNFDLALYQMNIKNLLVAERVGEDQYIGKNAGKTTHRGVELDLNYRLKISPNLSITPRASYTMSLHEFTDFVDQEEDFSGNELTGIPKHRFFNSISLDHEKGFSWSINHQFVGKIPLTDNNLLYSEPYHVFNTHLGFKKRMGKSFNLGIEFGLNNIFNKNYMQSVLINAVGFGGASPRYYYPSNNTHYYARLSIGFIL